MGHVEAELHGRGDLIDILPAGSGGADELLWISSSSIVILP